MSTISLHPDGRDDGRIVSGDAARIVDYDTAHLVVSDMPATAACGVEGGFSGSSSIRLVTCRACLATPAALRAAMEYEP